MFSALGQVQTVSDQTHRERYKQPRAGIGEQAFGQRAVDKTGFGDQQAAQGAEEPAEQRGFAHAAVLAMQAVQSVAIIPVAAAQAQVIEQENRLPGRREYAAEHRGRR